LPEEERNNLVGQLALAETPENLDESERLRMIKEIKKGLEKLAANFEFENKRKYGEEDLT
jgi:hypothetical protein